MFRFRLKFATAFAILTVMSGIGHADNLIVNSSFESGSYDSPGFVRVFAGETRIYGWSVGGMAVDWHVASENPDANPNFVGPHFGPAADGSLVIDLNLDGSGSGWIEQTFATVPGRTYEVSFRMAASDWFTNPRGVEVSVNQNVRMFHMAGSPQYDMHWERMVFTFVADSSWTTLRFSSPDDSGFWGPLLDDVQVHPAAAATPEVIRCTATTGLTGVRSIEVVFSLPLDARKGARNRSTYRIVSAGPDLRFDTPDDRVYPVQQVLTDVQNMTWRVFPAQVVPTKFPVRFTIFSSGIMDQFGNEMDSDFVQEFRFPPRRVR